MWKPQPHWLIVDWLGFVTPPAPGEYTILGTKRLPYVYDSNYSGTKAVIPSDDTAPYGVETPTAGTPLLAGVREAGGLHPLGARTFSKFIYHDLTYYYELRISCTCNMAHHLYGLRLAQPIKTKIQGVKYHVHYVQQQAQ